MKRLLFIFLFAQSLNISAQESIFSDTTYIMSLKAEVDNIYNFQFDNSEEVYKELEEKYPDHAFTQLFYAIMIYWKYFPIVPESEQYIILAEKTAKAISIVEEILEKDKSNTEAIFFNLMSRMFIMQYYADNGASSKVIPHLGRAYKMVTSGFDLSDSLIDFHFSTGVYNYYREAYPKAYPIYKPVAFFFPDGDIEYGLQQLEFNWENGIFLDAESLFFLVYINLNFEKNYDKSLEYLEHLNKAYPKNPLYLSYRIQTLLLKQEYDLALVYISKLRELKFRNDFFPVVSDIYEAIIQEKKNKNYSKATKMYAKSVKSLEKYGSYGNSYSSVAFYGLSRIYAGKDKKKSKEYRKLANDLAIYPHINFD
ncbi:MAG: hypothetical protein KOO66_11400 [Bacteroidales bacterium]|nr:hypothetical protein [Bacteroidales bacterium]